MSDIKTKIQRSPKEIVSQHKVIKNYAEQLKSAVVSSERKKAILNEMKSELTAKHYHPLKKKSISKTTTNTVPLIYTATTQASASSVQTAIDSSYIKSQRSTDFIKTARISYSGDLKTVITASKNLDTKAKDTEKALRLKAVLQNMQKKQLRLKNMKYNIAKADSDDSFAVETVQVVHSAESAIVQSSGMLRTAVTNTSKGVGTIHSMVKNGVKIGSARDIGNIATVVGGGIKNIAKDTGNQLLKTKIDKSKITDTGAETIKQGLTELRYADNTRKAVLNTARTAVKAGSAVKNMPKNTRAQVQRIKKNAERARKATQKTAEVMKKILTSKAGLIIMLALALILVLILLINGIVTVISATVSSMFAWMCPDGDASDESIKNNISTYISQIEQCEVDIQAEIDAIVNGLPPEYRYDGSQIDGLNKFGNSDLNICDYEAVLAILAVQKYQKVIDGETVDFSFTEEEIRSAVELFYDFSYHYEYDYCPDSDCSIDENCLLSLSAGSFDVTEIKYNSYGDYYEITLQGPTYAHVSSLFTQLDVYMFDGGTIGGSGYADVSDGIWKMTYHIGSDAYNQIDWNNFYLIVDTVFCNNPNHCYLYGEVINYDLDTVLNNCNFTEEQRELFEIYYLQIKSLMGE